MLDVVSSWDLFALPVPTILSIIQERKPISDYSAIPSKDKMLFIKCSTNAGTIETAVTPYETSALTQNFWNIAKSTCFQKERAELLYVE